jgi:hypothetical protein
MNLPIVFGAILAGAVVIDYGTRNVRQAFAASPAGSSSPAGSAPAGTGAVAGGKLNGNQSAFASRLQADTGLDPKVIAGWLLAEEPASSSTAPNGANNWLNIGAFDNGGWAFGGASVWADPQHAADATAAFMLGHPVNGITPPAYGSSGIRSIIASAGRGIQAQIAAIQRSGWATSGYPTLPSLVGANP